MEDRRFDELTRTLAALTNRRQVLRRLAGATGGGFLALVGIGVGEARHRRCGLGRRCRRDEQCASGFCDEDTRTCACPTGTTACHGACVDLTSDPDNCGACDRLCESGACQNGECVDSCAPPETICAGVCTDTRFDSNNCGSCGNACPPEASNCCYGGCTHSFC